MRRGHGSRPILSTLRLRSSLAASLLAAFAAAACVVDTDLPPGAALTCLADGRCPRGQRCTIEGLCVPEPTSTPTPCVTTSPDVSPTASTPAASSAPAARRFHGAALSGADLVVFGGVVGPPASGAAPDPITDARVWRRRDGSWTALAPQGGPGARARMAFAAAPGGSPLYVYGGVDRCGETRGDLYALAVDDAGARFTRLRDAAGGQGVRREHAAVVMPGEPVRLRVCGGELPLGGGEECGDLTAPDWQFQAATGTPPSPRIGHVMVHDAALALTVLFGGIPLGVRPPGTPVCHDEGDALCDLHVAGAEPGGCWRPMRVQPALPPLATHAAAVVAPGRIVVFGGHDGGDRWLALCLDTDAEHRGVWRSRDVAAPAAHCGYEAATLTYDAARGRLLVFGGSHEPSCNTVTELAVDPAWFPGCPPATAYRDLPSLLPACL